MVQNSVLKRTQSGVTLIMVAGVLSILAALGAGFYTICMMQSKSALHYSDTTRAQFMAQAGISDAIARMHELAYLKVEDPTDPWYTVDYCNNMLTRCSFAAIDKAAKGLTKERIPGDWKVQRTSYSRSLGNSANSITANSLEGGSDRYTLKVTDAASKINVNAGDNLGVLLDNLCRVIGIPLIAADLEYIQPRRWVVEGANAALYGKNTDDTSSNKDLYYKPDLAVNALDTPPIRHPVQKQIALYGDGYAIARYRSAHGRFKTVDDVKQALTVVANPTHPELEVLERELKFAVLKDYITIDSWVDTNSVCTGKFEWCGDPVSQPTTDMAIDRDKSWIADDITDTKNTRGSLRGCYVSIINGQGAGQYRRIKTNGIDWIQLEGGPWAITPGPISSYMIVTKEDATVGADDLPETDGLGKLKDDPNIDYLRYPLCIHRAPVNINTASDKVLMAMFLGIDVQHGHPLSVGTDVDYTKLVKDPLPSLYSFATTKLSMSNNAATDWKTLDDSLLSESYLLTPRGLKRIPADSGMPVLDRPVPWNSTNPELQLRFGYLNGFNSLRAPQFLAGPGVCNEVHEIVYRLLIARQPDADQQYQDSVTGHPTNSNALNCFKRGPFRSWDDLYFRVIKPWDDKRVELSLAGSGNKKKSVARMIMAHFNSNTDILKFNPNIEWIDRWGRNFSEMESILILDGTGPKINSADTQQYRPIGNKVPAEAGYPAAKVGSYFLRGRRYQSDEMIDKTDLNRSTTEFVFDSNGVFDLQSSGQVVKDGVCIAERKVAAVVKLYDVWRETTQRQFVNGLISNAAQKNKNGSSSGFTDAGRPTRDATNITDYKALDTLPEPLVPLKYTLDVTSKLNQGGGKANITDPLEPLNRANPYTPDIIKNKVLPASYDGQIVLAANQVGFSSADGDTFLASFNGDTDTATAAGNGRELAKTPIAQAGGKRQRVVDTIGLLGEYFPKGGLVEIDLDPVVVSSFYLLPIDPSLATTKPGSGDTDPVTGGVSSIPYWQNVQCRTGDLRADGVWLGAPGVSGKDATIKYEINGNFPASTTKQFTLNFWMKSTWRTNDGYEHEFFNATNLDTSKTLVLSKGRKFAGTFPGGDNSIIENRDCLVMSLEDADDHDYLCVLHDGIKGVDPKYVARPDVKTKVQIETPSYKVQPFRWSNAGCVARADKTATEDGKVGSGDTWGYAQKAGQTTSNQFFKDLVSQRNDTTNPNGGYGHPFIDTQRDPEGSHFGIEYYWFWRWVLGWNGFPAGGNDIASVNGAVELSGTKVFSINNYDRSQSVSIGRVIPSTGTEAVIDEYKISGAAWFSKRIGDEQTLSRYYLPSDPKSPGECPTFTSQTLLQSLRGLDNSAQAETVTLARVTWTVFTPRFMHENKDSNTYQRQEYTGGGSSPSLKNVSFRGPFDYCQYNREVGFDAKQGWKTIGANPKLPGLDLECERKPPPFDVNANAYAQGQATKGVEVEILDDYAVKGKTFIDPNVQNSIGSANNPIRIRTDRLHYRVRFRYPVDNVRVDTKAGGNVVDPDKQYLLDTPVFDDISVTYFTAPKILSYKEISE